MKERKFLIALSVALFLLWSCDVKDPIYETSHPDHGTITLTTDWTNRTTGVDIPASYTVKVGNYAATLSGATNTVDNLFVPGSYSLYVYNTAGNITVNGTTAIANYTAGAIGWFFTSAINAGIEADTDHVLTAVMQQQVRQLTLVIEPTGGTTDRIESITAALSGVAGSYDFESGTHGAVSSVPLAFAKDTDGKWKATICLLGVTGNEQKLTGTITYSGGSPADMTLESNLTAALASFNNDKKTPLTLGGQTVETPTETGFMAAITGWVEISGNGIAY